MYTDATKALEETKKWFHENHERRMKELREASNRVSNSVEPPVEPVLSEATSNSENTRIQDETGRMLDELLKDLETL